MGTAIGVIAFFVALVGVLAALGYSGYLWQLDRVAQQRAGGDTTRALVRKRMPVALGSTGVAAVGWLFTLGGVAPDIIGIILAGGAGLYSLGQLGQANKKL